MKKLVLASLLLVCGLVSCAGEVSSSSIEQTSQIQTTDEKNSEIALENFTGITFDSSTITYDGNPHTLEVSNAPEFATVTYENKGPFVNVGEYVIKATISAENYNNLVLEAKLKIVNADFNNIMFEDASFEYDGNPKTIEVKGSIPSNAVVIYSSDVEGVKNTATDIGVYHVTALIKAPNYNDLELTATLKITANDEKRYLKVSGDTLFFQNALHDNNLYAYNFNDKVVTSVNYDNAVEIEKYDDNSVIYISKSLSSSIRTASYDENSDESTYNTILNKHASYIQKGSSSIIYYVVNGLTSNSSGIYKADLSTQEPTITCLSSGKAKYLKLFGSKLYFADSENGDKLSSISTIGTNQTRTLVIDEKINNLMLNNGVLYFTVNNLLGDYIANYNINTSVTRKLTMDAGTDLTVIGDDLYYINVDLFTTSVIGNGIYKVPANPLVDYNQKGTKVIDGGEMGVCSLANYNDNLIYYDVNGYKLNLYNPDYETTINLLDGFVKPAEPSPLSMGSQIETKDGVIYYLDLYDGKTLHSYNPRTKMNFSLTSEKVDNFSLVGDYIYYNSVSYGVNNDTYRVNLKVSSGPELVNEYDSSDIVSYGNYIYYVERNASGASTAIHKANLDGSDDVIIFEYAADNLVLDNGTLYFCAKPNLVQTIMKIDDVANVTSPQEKVCVNKDYACDVFTVSNGVIYFRHNYGLAYKFHRLAKMNIDGTGFTEMVTDNTDPTEIIVDNGNVYYTNGSDTANDFNIYKVSINGTDNDKIKLTTDMYASSICLLDNEIYFINYYLGGLQGDSYLYSVSINGGDCNKIA